eukprot:976645_1
MEELDQVKIFCEKLTSGEVTQGDIKSKIVRVLQKDREITILPREWRSECVVVMRWFGEFMKTTLNEQQQNVLDRNASRDASELLPEQCGPMEASSEMNPVVSTISVGHQREELSIKLPDSPSFKPILSEPLISKLLLSPSSPSSTHSLPPAHSGRPDSDSLLPPATNAPRFSEYSRSPTSSQWTIDRNRSTRLPRTSPKSDRGRERSYSNVFIDDTSTDHSVTE